MFRYLSVPMKGWISCACWTAVAALAMFVGSGAAQAQTGGQFPWQISLQKANHTGDLTKLTIDLPLPATGKLLAIQQVSVELGPTFSNYGKLLRCELQTSGPRTSQLYSIDDPIRVRLPLPVPLGTATKTTTIPLTQVLVFSEAATNGILRVSCDAENIYFTDKLAVSAAGYVTDSSTK